MNRREASIQLETIKNKELVFSSHRQENFVCFFYYLHCASRKMETNLKHFKKGFTNSFMTFSQFSRIFLFTRQVNHCYQNFKMFIVILIFNQRDHSLFLKLDVENYRFFS